MNARHDGLGPAVPAQLRELLDGLAMPAALLAADGAVVHANAAMQAHPLGADPRTIPGAHLSHMTHGTCVLVLPEAKPDPQMQRLASLGFMLAGVCHEVSNPLAAIHSMVQILQSRRGVTRDTLHKGLDAIAANVVRVLGITRKLGDFSRVTGDAPRPQPIDSAMRDALGLLRHSRWGEEVEVEYRGLADAVVVAPPGELQQVFLNLMLNAAQAMGGRGRIEISTERPQAGQLRVRVRDHGPGIPEQNLPHIFEPFFTTKAPGEGTGLGLAICNEIVHELGGTLCAHNVDGGLAMEVHLPAGA